MPSETNPLTGRALVRERDAHAWVEAFLDGEGGSGRWVPFDPTPWRSRDEALGIDRQPSRLGALAGAAFAAARRLWASPRILLEALRSPWALALLSVLLIWRLALARRGARGPREARSLRAADAQLHASYQRYLRALRRSAQLKPLPAETDDELLSRLQAARGEGARHAAEQFLHRYREARYRPGAARPDLGPPLAALEEELKARA